MEIESYDEPVTKEKNSIAQGLDKLFESVIKKRMEAKEATDSDVLNMLPKPTSQDFGDGIIIWRWNLGDGIVIESILATRTANQANLEKDTYVVTMQLPKSDVCAYSLFDETAKELGSALLSAWNWQHIWKAYAGDFILSEMSKEPPQVFESEPAVNDDDVPEE